MERANSTTFSRCSHYRWICGVFIPTSGNPLFRPSFLAVRFLSIHLSIYRILPSKSNVRHLNGDGKQLSWVINCLRK